MMNHVIEIHGVKQYDGDVQALNGVELPVCKGKISGLLGPMGLETSWTLREFE